VGVTSELVHEFAAAIAGPDLGVDLFGAAMLIAQLRGGPVDANEVARRLDLMAEAVREQAGETTEPDRLAHAIDHHLFSVLGFHGDSERYNDPENSYLDKVIERRRGIPITLSLLYMEVAQRVGLACDGIGYPGHFVVRCGPPEAAFYVDPFHQGARLDRAELLAGLRSEQLGGAAPESFLAGVTRRQVIQRMLNNLHLIFREQREMERWLSVVELSACLEPWNSALIGERGMLRYRLGRGEEALEDLERYVEAGERETVSAGARRLLDELRLRYRGAEGV
jgi:regulator of sirC expression with transglutaminase-like and TPR domain